MNDSVFEGLSVLSLMPGSVAERAGVQRGDRVLVANGQRVDSLLEYIKARGMYADRLELTLKRGQQILDMVLVFDRPDGGMSPTATA